MDNQHLADSPVQEHPTDRSRKKPLIVIISIVIATAVGWAIGIHFSFSFLGAGLGAAAGIWAGALIADEHAPAKQTGKDDLAALNSYIEGKMDRYKLLFAINGGAFAVAQFLLKDDSNLRAVLPISYLAEGCIVFTAIMAADLWLFAQMMRQRFVGNAAFTVAGKAILLMITALIMGGWFIVLRSWPMISADQLPHR